MNYSVRLAVSALLLSCLFSSCGGSREPARPELHPAQGTFLVNGTPAPGAMLILAPASGQAGIDERGTRPTATIQEDGSFRISTYADEDGVPVGEYQVGVIWIVTSDEMTEVDRLGGKFSNPASTGLRISIHAGDNQLGSLELKQARVSNVPAASVSGKQ